jgi:hypothetical protein
MHVRLDGSEVEVPAAATLAELLEGIAPHIEPSRLVTQVEVDGAAADPTDERALSAWRLAGSEGIRVDTESPEGFASTRRAEIAGHLCRLADMIAAAADGFASGGDTVEANRTLAVAARDLSLVLELDQAVGQLDGGTSRCLAVRDVVERIGTRLNEAEQARRWSEVATLLSGELVPALRAGAA